MAMLKFNYGKYENLVNKAYSDGNVYITTDEKAMYVDVDNQRIRVGQIIYTTSSAVKPPYSEESFYYFSDLNALATWGVVDAAQGTKGWIQINSTSDIKADIADLKTRMGTAESNIGTMTNRLSTAESKIEQLQNANSQENVIEKISVGGTDVTPDSEKRVKLGKFAAENKTTISYSEFDTDFQNRITTVETNITNLQGEVNSTAGKISSAIDSFNTTTVVPLTNRVDQNEQAITGINNKIGTETYTGSSLTGAIKQLQTDVGANTNNITSLTNELNTVKSTYATTQALNTAKSTLESKIEEAKTAASTADGKAQAAQNGVNALNGIVGGGISGTTLTDKVTSVADDLTTLTQQIGSLSNIMNFRGVYSKTADVTNPAIGDVIIVGEKEYVYATVENVNQWVEYGDASGNAGAITELDGRIDALETTVGGPNSGLVQTVANHTTAIDTNATNITNLTNNLNDNYYKKTQIDTMLSWGSF